MSPIVEPIDETRESLYGGYRVGVPRREFPFGGAQE